MQFTNPLPELVISNPIPVAISHLCPVMLIPEHLERQNAPQTPTAWLRVRDDTARRLSTLEASVALASARSLHHISE